MEQVIPLLIAVVVFFLVLQKDLLVRGVFAGAVADCDKGFPVKTEGDVEFAKVVAGLDGHRGAFVIPLPKQGAIQRFEHHQGLRADFPADIVPVQPLFEEGSRRLQVLRRQRDFDRFGCHLVLRSCPLQLFYSITQDRLCCQSPPLVLYWH